METKQLIILGNGFDLSVGLPSRYTDYFSAIREDADHKKFDRTIWNGIFRVLQRGDTEQSWYDVEDELFEFLYKFQLPVTYLSAYYMSEDSGSAGSISEIKSQYKSFSDYMKKGENPKGDGNQNHFGWHNFLRALIYTQKDSSGLLSEKEIDKLFELVELFSEYFDDRRNQPIGVWNTFIDEMNTKQDEITQKIENSREFIENNPFIFDSFLIDELQRFEKNFANYIKNEAKNDKYQRQSSSLFNKLNGLDLPPTLAQENMMSNVFSFNYTVKANDMNCTGSFTNVHGNVDDSNGVIFGIDSEYLITENTVDDKTMNRHLTPFTKTYRTLMNTDNESFDNQISGGLECIKVFGHSLSLADYAYYQSIFDAVDLYDSNVRLIFYYNNHKGGNDSSCRIEKFNAVTELLNHYGSYLPNKQQGRNLMHRLQLENRLKIRDITDIVNQVQE